MSQQNPIRVFVTHAFEHEDDYVRVFEFLESSRNFYYRNTGTPDRPPSGDKEAVRDDLRRQISPAEVVIGLPSLHAAHRELLTFQLLYAQASDKPVILMRPFGSGAELPKALVEHASEVLDWDERALVDALKRHARHEDTARWDTIEFKLD